LPTDAVDDLEHALVLADLLAEDTVPGPRPPRPADGVDEITRLRASVRQLEHALSSRVIVEQAIGVLSERWRVVPRDAFEQLRRVTRSHGLRIHDLAKLVIESSLDPDVGLPAELVPVQRSADTSLSPDTPRSADTPPEPRQSPDVRGRNGDGGERQRRTRRPDPGGSPNGRVTPAAPAPRTPQGRRAPAER
jgi:ANTAR domain